MNEQKLDLVTVANSGDLHLLQLQARSIALNVSPGLVGHIYLIVNDADHDVVIRTIWQDILPEYGPFADRVRFVDHDVNWVVTAPGSGWYSQQVLKLLVSRSVENAHYLVLDAKNHFIRPVDVSAFFAQDGRMRSHRPKMSDRFLPNYRNALSYLGGTCGDETLKALPTTTPFIMRRDFSAGLVDHVEKREGRPFKDFFWDNQDLYTEFCLYSAFVEQLCGGIDQHYKARSKPNATLYRGSANDLKKCRKVLKALRKPDIICMGVHPHVIDVGNEAVLRGVWKSWRKFGLVRDVEEAKTFLKTELAMPPRRSWGILDFF